MATTMTRVEPKKTVRGSVYCWICTHTVEADVILVGKKVFVRPGQKCPRCSSSLDPASVVRVNEAA